MENFIIHGSAGRQYSPPWTLKDLGDIESILPFEDYLMNVIKNDTLKLESEEVVEQRKSREIYKMESTIWVKSNMNSHSDVSFCHEEPITTSKIDWCHFDVSYDDSILLALGPRTLSPKPRANMFSNLIQKPNLSMATVHTNPTPGSEQMLTGSFCQHRAKNAIGTSRVKGAPAIMSNPSCESISTNNNWIKRTQGLPLYQRYKKIHGKKKNVRVLTKPKRGTPTTAVANARVLLPEPHVLHNPALTKPQNNDKRKERKSILGRPILGRFPGKGSSWEQSGTTQPWCRDRPHPYNELQYVQSSFNGFKYQPSYTDQCMTPYCHYFPRQVQQPFTGYPGRKEMNPATSMPVTMNGNPQSQYYTPRFFCSPTNTVRGDITILAKMQNTNQQFPWRSRQRLQPSYFRDDEACNGKWRDFSNSLQESLTE